MSTRGLFQYGFRTDRKIRNRARKNKLIAVLLAIFLPPIAYIYIGKWAWALVNLLTANFLFLGFIIVPIHTYMSINSAKEEAGLSN